LWNDSEEVFSCLYKLFCWMVIRLAKKELIGIPYRKDFIWIIYP